MPIANIDTGSEFVEGWFITQTLGEGAYGEVKLVTGKTNGEVVAMKVLDFSRFPDAETIVRKEISIHRKLNHPHIIRYYAHRREETVEYMFLEYASGGELFDRIEPEYGMKMSDAQKYFRQLLLGVEYLHSLGITHRDLKPENLLLDSKDNIKIIDFGMATWFRFKGEERKLDQRCGTVPYISPEVLTKSYLAQPAELWTCGIILVALIAGELPFDNATKDCSRYNNWLQGNITESPFTRISNLDLAFIRKILNPTPHLRLTLAQMKSHSWLTKDKVEDFYRQKGNSKGDAKGIKRVRSGSALTASSNGSKILSSYSQPEILDKEASNAQMPYINLTSFSQPEQPDNMLLSQPNGNQSQNNPLQKLVKRMTRFFVTTNIEETVKKLEELSTELHYVFKRNSVALVTFSISDCHHVQLIFKATLFDMQKRILVDFRLSKGDGLEFKRQFKKIRQCLQPIISPDTIEDDAINNSE